MIDKALFVSNSGAKNSMRHLEIITNNLANINTTGFRADYELMRHESAGDKNVTRTYSVPDTSYSDFNPGPMIKTDRELDVAINGKGFIAVQNKEGKEAYTRAGDLVIDSKGFLTTKKGDLVKGQNGFIQMGDQVARVTIGNDGTVAIRNIGDTNFAQINRIKLADPDVSQLSKGADGNFYLPNDGSTKLDESITLITGSLEGSNVNPVATLTQLIELSRTFEQHTNMMKMMTDEASQANRLLEIQR